MDYKLLKEVWELLHEYDVEMREEKNNQPGSEERRDILVGFALVAEPLLRTIYEHYSKK
jgi:hypothetical protein